MHQSDNRTRQARNLRAEMTGAESRLWDMLRARRFEGLKFRRQTPVAGVIADFFCAELKLVIELDGGVHALKTEADAARDARLGAAGFVVLRAENEAFMRNPNDLLAAIRRHAESLGK